MLEYCDLFSDIKDSDSDKESSWFSNWFYPNDDGGEWIWIWHGIVLYYHIFDKYSTLSSYTLRFAFLFAFC